MYVAIRHYRMNAGTIDAMAKRVETEFADRIPAEVGSALYTAADTGNGTATTITMFSDEETFRSSAAVVEPVHCGAH